jgi:colanic acid/amylovoran biosynthesis protein
VRVIVLWADPESPNLGSQMLAEGILSFLKGTPGYKEISFISHNQIRQIRQTKWYSIRGILRLKSQLNHCELIIDMGDGDSFATQYGFTRFVKICALRLIARSNSTKVILGPQSIGAFTGINKIIAKFSLAKVKAVAGRDTDSMKSLSSIFEGPSTISTDISWLIQTPLSSGERAKKCLINLNGLFFNSNSSNRDAFQESLANLVSVLKHRNYGFDFMYHVAPNQGLDNDRVWGNYIASNFPHAQVFCPSHFLQAREILQKYEFSVGSRYHFCLNSVQANTPCIPIYYSAKFSSIYQNIPIQSYWGTTITITEWSELIAKFCSIDLDKNRETQQKMIEGFSFLYAKAVSS